jgi:hypothetical protein
MVNLGLIGLPQQSAARSRRARKKYPEGKFDRQFFSLADFPACNNCPAERA